jgi:serine/threonine protein phosphatase PrpC
VGVAALRASVEEGRSTLEFEVAGRTDIGMVRHTNQDAFGVEEPLGLVVICDGMGGMAGGEVASHVAIESFLEVARREIEASRSADAERTKRALCRAAAAANRAVRARASYDTRFRGMGTTLVAARLDGNELTVVNVGDSRAYLVHGGVTRQVTRDHSYVAEQMRMGLMTEREAERSPYQSAITRAIGIDDDVQPDFYTEAIEAGDDLLLCSDGLMRHMKDDEIGKIVADATMTPGEICERLIAMVNARGGTDNVTCVVMRFGAALNQG